MEEHCSLVVYTCILHGIDLARSITLSYDLCSHYDIRFTLDVVFDLICLLMLARSRTVGFLSFILLATNSCLFGIILILVYFSASFTTFLAMRSRNRDA